MTTLQSRRSKRVGSVIFAAALTLGLAACGNNAGDGGQGATSSSATSTKAASTEKTTSRDKTSKKPAPTRGQAATEPAPQQTPQNSPAPAAGQGTAPLIGHTEAPGQVSATPMNKTLSHCGDIHLHQVGTSFFTDGTSGWTQTCYSQMLSQMEAEGVDISIYE